MMSNSPKVPECNLSSCNRTIAISVTSCSCLCFSEIKVEQNVLSPLQLVDCFICSKNGSSPLKSFSLYQNNGVTGGDRKDLPVLEKANLPQKCHMSP